MYSAQLIYLAGNNVWQNSLDSESAPNGTAVQIHLPLRPSPGGCLLVDGATIPLCPTEGWMVGGACRYDLRNPSPSALLHLVVRCAASDALLTELQAAPALVTPRTVAETFAHLCHYLLSDEALLRPFQHTDDTRQFVQCLINTAQALGYALTETDVVDAMRGSHHTWIKQWIV